MNWMCRARFAMDAVGRCCRRERRAQTENDVARRGADERRINATPTQTDLQLKSLALPLYPLFSITCLAVGCGRRVFSVFR